MTDSSVQRSIDKAAAALNAMRSSGSLDEAEDAWIEFLHHANRAVNKLKASSLPDILKLVWADDRMTYIREARNTDEHTIEPLTVRSRPPAKVYPAIDIGLGDGLAMAMVGGGEAQVAVGLGNGFALAFSVESLHLLPVTTLNGTVLMPPSDDSYPMTPSALADYGLAWVEARARDLP